MRRCSGGLFSARDGFLQVTCSLIGLRQLPVCISNGQGIGRVFLEEILIHGDFFLRVLRGRDGVQVVVFGGPCGASKPVDVGERQGPERTRRWSEPSAASTRNWPARARDELQERMLASVNSAMQINTRQKEKGRVQKRPCHKQVKARNCKRIPHREPRLTTAAGAVF